MIDFKIEDNYKKILEGEIYSKEELHLTITNTNDDFLGEIILSKDKAIDLRNELNKLYGRQE